MVLPSKSHLKHAISCRRMRKCTLEGNGRQNMIFRCWRLPSESLPAAVPKAISMQNHRLWKVVTYPTGKKSSALLR
jgi:hypothetical protein